MAVSSTQSAFSLHLRRLLTGELPVVLHFQPVVDLRRGVVTGFEALSRFPAEMGLSPDVCFATADLLGARLELEQVVTLEALKSREKLPGDCFLTINVSPDYLISEQWQAVLSTCSDLAGVVIEITEEASINNYELARVRLAQIRALGGSIAVDDAGSGYASLQHVLEMKPDFIKLDRMFVQNCHTDRAKAALIEMMGNAANRLDAWIIAEGIETLPELEELLRLGVPLGQGYYLERPGPEMKAISSDKRDTIQAWSHKVNERGSLGFNMETCESCSSFEKAHTLLSETQGPDTVIVTDQWGRPLEVVERHPLLGLRRLPGFMKVQLSSTPAEVLHRALTRSAVCRFDPLVAIDGDGELQGLVRIDRLMRAQLETPE